MAIQRLFFCPFYTKGGKAISKTINSPGVSLERKWRERRLRFLFHKPRCLARCGFLFRRVGSFWRSPTTRVFEGLIDKIAIFNVSLTLLQIQQSCANDYKLPPLQVNLPQTGTNLNLTWPQGMLSQSSDVTGTWVPVTPTLALANGSMFYRISLQTSGCVEICPVLETASH